MCLFFGAWFVNICEKDMIILMHSRVLHDHNNKADCGSLTGGGLVA